jgi:PKD repeat protein
MKSFTVTFIIVLSFFSAFAQKSWVPFTSSQAQTPLVTIDRSDRSSIIFDVTLTGMFSELITREGLTFQRISLNENQTTQEIGKPELPALHQLIGIPDNQLISFVVSDIETMKLTGFNIYPFQTPTTDNPGGQSKAFVMDKSFYGQDVNFPLENVNVDQPEIWRDIRISGIHITPFTFNPAKQELTVITRMKVKVEFTGNDTKTALIRGKELTPKFYNMYKHAIVNFDDLGYTQTLKETSGIKYLIITNTEALNAIQPLVDFKNRQGMKVEVKILETGFNTPQLFKNYITQLYNSDGLEYVLMVGDAYPNGGTGGGPNIVPMYWWEPSGEDPSYSDSWYTCLQGDDDHFADLAIGRLVYDFNSLNELELQIQKTMTHYLAPDVTSNWAENALLIAHKEEYPLKFTQCCEEIRTYPYSVQVPIFEKAYGGEGASNQQVINFVNNTACGIFGYRGHGSSTDLWQWGSSGNFSASHVAQLNNMNKLFVFFDVCCENMNIVSYNGDCLTESFMKHQSASVAVNGAIIPSFTIPNHDYDKEMFKAIYDEDITNIGYVTNFANITVLNVHGTMGRSNVRTYLWLGDASLEPWTKQPANLTVAHDPQLFLGVSEFSLQVTGEGGAAKNALVCVSNQDGTIYSAGYTDALGVVTLTFDDPVQTLGEAMVTVTLHNYLPYQVVIPVIPKSVPFVGRDTWLINDTAGGNGNGLLDCGEAVLLSLAVKNFGAIVAKNVVVTISTNDDYTTITDSTENYGNIQPLQAVSVADGFSFNVANSMPDSHSVLFEVTATNGLEVWTSSFVIVGHAPVLDIFSFIIDDTSGNNNGLLDPGETVALVVSVGNNGTATAYNVMGLLTTTNPFVSVLTNEGQSFGNISPSSNATLAFTISAASNTPYGYSALLNFAFTASMGITAQEFIQIILADYCDASINTKNEFISKVVCGTISNSSDWQSDVADYTNITAVLVPGVPKPITVTNGAPWSGDKVTVWIDWNLNVVLGDANETNILTNVGGAGASFTGNITAPANQAPGSYRMRIRMTPSLSPTPCGTTQYGEIEDFVVIIESFTAIFTSNITSVCKNGQVQFTDNSTGVPTSWLWTFPGGTPATSTKKNPLVTYNTAGTFDVTLKITKGTLTNTLTKTGYITVMPPPVQAGPISGNGMVISGQTETYSVSPLAQFTNYEWVLTPVAAGSMVVAMNTATITWGNSWTGLATLKVRGGNVCGIGAYSSGFEVTVTAPCYAPNSISANNIKSESAELIWSPGYIEAGWNILYDSSGFNPNTDGTLIQGINETSYILTDLTSATTYDFYIRSDCGNGNYSSWAGPATFTTLTRQIINLTAGWSGLSSFLTPSDQNIESLFNPIISDLIIFQDETGIYWPGQNVNTIGVWDTHQGYKIKMATAVDLIIEGTQPNNRNLTFSNGWNLIPVLSNCNVDVETLFPGINLVMLKEVAGSRIYWPAMGINNLGYLEPGKAYFVLMNGEGTIGFPECGNMK